MAEAFFDNSRMNTTYAGDYTLNPLTLILPNARGYGLVPDLDIAMSLDPALLEMVLNLTFDSTDNAATFGDQITAIAPANDDLPLAA